MSNTFLQHTPLTTYDVDDVERIIGRKFTLQTYDIFEALGKSFKKVSTLSILSDKGSGKLWEV
ncbi:hypothetical protein NR798_36795 [Archangium gephyra]|uniref:hypothetical protein n=1 Tax=Archangium gephyra TaxID=48 RepID=UPI0035D42B7F